MNENNANPYQTPEANLNISQPQGKIVNFKRFTAWGVFGLSVITLGIYPIYWMYSRALTVNDNHGNKISMGLLHGLIAATVFSFAAEFLGDSETAAMVSLVVTVAYMVLYLIVLFTLRARLQDIINVNNSPYNQPLSGVLTFLFNCIYLQYKINEAIDSNQ